MKDYKVLLIERIKRTDSVDSFRFEPQEQIEFLPGQFLQVMFDEKNKENRDLNKYLSFSSSPTRKYIEVTKRLSTSNFSRHLNGLRIGDAVLIKAPMGNCVLRQEDSAITFLIGGIGITPAISIIEYVIDKKLSVDIELFYSNRKDDDIAFRKVLDQWQKLNNNIKIIYLVTDCPSLDKSCMFGSIDTALVCRESKCLEKRVLFMFGPPKMVDAMKGLCSEMGCATDKMRTEGFVGY